MKKKFLLVTAFGQDRPGIVAEVTRVLFQKGCNIEDSSMTRLGGEFCMMLMVAQPVGAASTRSLESALRPVAKALNLQVNVKELPASALRRDSEEGLESFLISVYGVDRPGIVYGVARALAEARINITDLNTRRTSPKDKPLYVLLLEVKAPPPCSAESLRKSLQKTAEELGVDITVQDLEPVSL